MVLMTGVRSVFCARQRSQSIEMPHKTYVRWLGGIQNDRKMQHLEQIFGTALTPKKIKALQGLDL
jgi:hypothetical protein